MRAPATYEEVNREEEGRHEEGRRQEEVAVAVLDSAIVEHQPSHVFALFSGGHDSLAALAVTARHPRFTAAAFINTGTGIPRTVEFVRATCERSGWPLIELAPDRLSYEDLIRQGGFGHGVKSHATAYYWLKQRQVRRLVRDHKQGRNGRVMLTTGVRRSESTRRMAAAISVPVRREGAQVWVNPILDWSARDCSDLIERDGLERNEVVATLHRSGECLCATLFAKGERTETLLWAPEMRPRVAEWERIAKEAGHKNCAWGVPGPNVHRDQGELFDLPLCTSCVGAAA